jgi:hypothetical protein
VDLERGVVFLSDSKTGAKTVYLSAAALAVLVSLPRIHGNPHIVPGEKAGAPRMDLKKPWAALKRAAKLDGVRIHDLRHSFASVGAGVIARPDSSYPWAASEAGSPISALKTSDAACPPGNRGLLAQTQMPRPTGICNRRLDRSGRLAPSSRRAFARLLHR